MVGKLQIVTQMCLVDDNEVTGTDFPSLCLMVKGGVSQDTSYVPCQVLHCYWQRFRLTPDGPCGTNIYK